MKIIFYVAIAGAIGALSRFAMVSWIGSRYFPWATLTVNALGSFAMGVAFIVIVEKGLVDPSMKPLLMTGGLGAFTTFSAFSLETWDLFEKGDWLSAALYILVSVALCLVAVGVGITLARHTIS